MVQKDRADNQAIDTRFGDSLWLTDYITPDNPDVILKYRELTEGMASSQDKIKALWQYVANIRYCKVIHARISIGGKSYSQSDCWLYPAEVIRLAPAANCANKSFLLASLLLNELPQSDIHCVIGHITVDGVGAHAWVEAKIGGINQILEATVTDPSRAMIPAHLATIYDPVIYFTDESVYTVYDAAAVETLINERFGFCAIEFLREYICERCLEL